jgi:hypothetical protein
MHVPREKRKKLNSRATSIIFVGYSISTKQYFQYDPLAKRLHQARDLVFVEGEWYTAPNGAHKAILNANFVRDVIEEPKPKHIEKQPSEHQTEEPLEHHPPQDPPKSKKKSRQLPGLEM